MSFFSSVYFNQMSQVSELVESWVDSMQAGDLIQQLTAVCQPTFVLLYFFIVYPNLTFY